MRYCCLIVLALLHFFRLTFVLAQEVSRSPEVVSRVVWPSRLPCAEGSQLFCRYQPAIEDAQKTGKHGVLVFFSREGSPKLDILTQGSFSLPHFLKAYFNVVVLSPGLISPTDFPLKMDPMILYMAEFSEECPEILNYENPCLCCILLNQDGTSRCIDVQEIL